MLNQKIALFGTVFSVAMISIALRAEIGSRHASATNGVWVGHWKADGDPGAGKPLVCKTVQVGRGTWMATFNAVCDKDYAFTMEVPGRKVGDRVEFAVTVDLGQDYGGEYHWTGSVVGKEFNGIYTNAHYNGTFHMAKAKDGVVATGIYCEVPQTGDVASADSTE